MSEDNNSPETKPTSAPPAAPRWVKILGIVGLIVVVLVLLIIALGIGGEHGPGRHNPSGALENSLSLGSPLPTSQPISSYFCHPERSEGVF